MNRIKYIWGILIVLCCLQACYDDNSKLADQPIIEVNILPTAKDSINIYFNNTLEIKADIESETDALTYQWDMGLYAEDPKTGESTTVFKNISQEKDLSYVVRELGHYHLRQIVTSEDGSTIKYYHVFVNSQFEEGFTILERRPDGKGGISFLKTLTPEEIEAGMEPSFMQNAFAYANGGKELYLDPVDIDKVGNYLYILHGESQKLVQIDAKTFEEIYEYDFKFYQLDFVPTTMMTCDYRYCTEFTVTSKNGGVAMVQVQQQAIFPFPGLPQGTVYTDGYDRPSYFSSSTEVFISKDRDAVCWSGANGYDPFFSFQNCFDYFKGMYVLKIFQNEKSDGNDVFVVYRDGGQTKVVGIHSAMLNLSTGKGLWVLFERPVREGIITEESQILPNDYYTCAFVSHKNEVYKWFYTQLDLDAMPFIKLPEGEEIRCLNHYQKSRNDSNYQDYSVQKEIYIASYNPNREGEFKGSLWVYNADTGKLINKYEGISYEPVDMFYKIK